jgi:hypothetical protein
MIYPLKKLTSYLFYKVIGLDLNFKKISHWNISEFLINLLISNFGLNSQIIVNLTNDQKNRNLSPTSKSLHLLFNNGSLAKLSAIDIQQADLINIDTIRTKFIDTGTYTPFFIFIDESLIKLFVDLFIIKFPKIGILKIMRLFKELQDPLKFRVYPPVPALDVLSKKSKYSLLKQVLAVFIDKHEF